MNRGCSCLLHLSQTIYLHHQIQLHLSSQVLGRNSKGGRQRGGYIKGNKGTSVKKSVLITKKVTCTYCKGAHTANNCDAVEDYDKRLEIVKR